MAIFTTSFSKILGLILVDLSGFWTARLTVQAISFLGLLMIYTATPLQSWKIFYGMPLFFAFNVGLLFLFLTHSVLFPVQHRGKYFFSTKYMYSADALIFRVYLACSFAVRKYFWLCLLLVQPFCWARSILMTPRRNFQQAQLDEADRTGEYNKIKLGWETRNDPIVKEEGVGNKLNPITYLSLIVKAMNLEAWAVCFWTATEILTFVSLNAQIGPYLYWKLPYSEQKEEVYIKEYTTFYANVAFWAMTIGAPIFGTSVDLVSKLMSKKFNYSKKEAGVFSAVCLMTFLTSMNIICHLILLSSEIDSTTNNLKNKWTIYATIILTVSCSSHCWMARNIFTFASFSSLQSQRILSMCNLLQIVTPLIGAQVPKIIKNYFDGNWDDFFGYFNVLPVVNLIFPGFLIYRIFKNKNQGDKA